MEKEKKKICATCFWCSFKEKKNDVPKDGYCNVNPPQPGGFWPKVNLIHTACQFYKQKPES